MKSIHLCSLFLLASFTASCRHTEASSLKGEPVIEEPSTDVYALVPMAANLKRVVAEAADAPALGLWTRVEVDYAVPCSATIASIGLSMHAEGDQFTVLSSAYLTEKRANADEVQCQSIAVETRSLILPGIVDASRVKLVNLTAEEVRIPEGTNGIRRIPGKDAKIAAVKLSNSSASAPTTVELLFSLKSCVNSVGPVAYAVIGDRLFVHALEFESRLALVAFCQDTVFVGKGTLLIDETLSQDAVLTVIDGEFREAASEDSAASNL